MKRWIIPVIPWYHLHIDDWFEELLHECTEYLWIVCGRWNDIQQSRYFVSLWNQTVQRSKIKSSFQSVHDSLRTSVLLRREWFPHADSIPTSHQNTKGLLLQSRLSNESLRIWYSSVHGTVRGEIKFRFITYERQWMKNSILSSKEMEKKPHLRYLDYPSSTTTTCPTTYAVNSRISDVRCSIGEDLLQPVKSISHRLRVSPLKWIFLWISWTLFRLQVRYRVLE